jgi:hypothetical protein
MVLKTNINTCTTGPFEVDEYAFGFAGPAMNASTPFGFRV